MDGVDSLVTAADPSAAPFKPLPMNGADISVDRRADGGVVITSNHPPGDGPRTISHLLADKAAAHPDRPYLKQREPGHGPWRQVTYGQAQRAVEGVAQKCGLPEDRVVGAVAVGREDDPSRAVRESLDGLDEGGHGRHAT